MPDTLQRPYASYLTDEPCFPFCKGCGHTSVIRRLNEALVALQLPPENVALVTDIGCIGLADKLFKNIHTVHTTHGRSTAFATGIALADSVLAPSGLSDRKLKTVVLIGDGGAMIGLQHLVHAAMLNVDVTVLICNNFVYGMTGGQGSALTPELFITATTPEGNIVPPIDICGILEKSNAPFVARSLATDRDLPGILREAIAFPGFAAVEILELCTEYAVPSNELNGIKLTEIAQRNGWKFGILKDSPTRMTFSERYRRNGASEHKAPLPSKKQRAAKITLPRPTSIFLAGSAGERVQSAASMLCQAAIDSGLHVTQKNDNPVTQGSGFSLSELWLSSREVGYTGIEQPDIVVITSAEGLAELRDRRALERLGKHTVVYVEDSLKVEFTGCTVHRLPFRKTFSPLRAALGALAFVAVKHRLVDRKLLEETLCERLGDTASELLNKANELLNTERRAQK